MKVLGPTLDVVGKRLADLTDDGMENFGRVVKNAASKTSPEQLEEPWSPNKRVLKAVIDEAEVAEDEILVDYLGGILATARSGVSRDDRVTSLLALIKGMSTYQLRMHYVLYRGGHLAMVGKDIDLRGRGRFRSLLYVSIDELANCMDFTRDELDDLVVYLAHAISGLCDLGLISDRWAFGEPDHLRDIAENRVVPDQGLCYELTHRGIELFWIAQGRDGEYAAAFSQTAIPPVVGMPEPSAQLVRELPRQKSGST